MEAVTIVKIFQLGVILLENHARGVNNTTSVATLEQMAQEVAIAYHQETGRPLDPDIFTKGGVGE